MYLIYLVLTVLMVLSDYFTKALAVQHLKGIATMPVIKGVFHLTYCENTGGAFSIFSGNPYLLALVSSLLIVAILVYIMLKKPKSHLLLVSLSMIVAGGTGNIIDRVVQGYVVDFFDFRIINFAVFNVADIFVCLGMALLVLYVFLSEKAEKKPQKEGFEK